MAVKGPLRKVVDRRQSFQTTQRYPDGWIVETLECGHELLQDITPDPRAVVTHPDTKHRRIFKEFPDRRRCKDCAIAAKPGR